MKSATLNSEPQKSFHVILIVDKVGIVGEALAKEFAKDYLVVFLSAAEVKKEKNIIPVKFKKRIPEAPEAKYKKIFLIDDGASVTRESAFSFTKLARSLDAPLYFIGSLRNVDVEHADMVAAEYSNSKVLIFGDIFDKKIFFDKNASISKYIIEARKLGKIEVPGNGLNISFPVSFDDTIKLVIKATTLNLVQKSILLFYPHPITDISLANVFQKVNPDLKVDFGKAVKEKKVYYPKNAVHAISRYDLEKKIRDLDLEDAENREVKVINKERRQKNRIFKPILFFALACLFLLLLPFFSTAGYTKLGEWEINNAIASAGRGEFGKALKQTQDAQTFFQIAAKTSDTLSAEASVFNAENQVAALKKNIESGESLAGATSEALVALNTLGDIYLGKSTNPAEDFTKASENLKSAVTTVSKLQAEGELPVKYQEKVKNLEPFIELFVNSSDVLPSILGFSGEKNYLILFENNDNLRPGGGVIDSIADISVKDARITKFEVFKPNQIDTEIKLDTDPPFEYRRFMGEKNILIKDSLNSPDFVKSAITAANLYSKSTGKQVDGVIGIDKSALDSLLSLSRGVVLSGQQVNSGNLASLSTGEMGNVAKAFKEQAFNKKISLVDLAESAGKLISGKDLNFAMQDVGTQNIFTANGWSSAIWDNRENQEGVINDFFGLSETNLSNNRVGPRISRSVIKKVYLENSGRVSSSVEAAYKNNSTTDGYLNYVKVILPAGSKLNSVAIDGEEQPIVDMQTDPKVYESVNFKKPSGVEVYERDEFNKNIYALVLNIPRNSIKKLTFNYDLPNSFSSADQSITYSLKLFKQPGISVFPFSLSFDLPENLKIIKGEDPYSTQLSSDQDLEYTISQK